MISHVFTNKKTKRELFKRMYEENFNYIYAFTFARLAGNKEATEDIVHETFFAAMKSMEGFKNKSSCKTWLCGIAKHKIINYYQRDLMKNDYSCLEENTLCMYEDTVDSNILKSEKRKEVLEVLNNINPSYRYALVLKYIDEYSVKEIAAILNKTPKAIDGILQRARLEFKKEYSKYIGVDCYEARGSEI